MGSWGNIKWKWWNNVIDQIQEIPMYFTWWKLAQLTMTRMIIFNNTYPHPISQLLLKQFLRMTTTPKGLWTPEDCRWMTVSCGREQERRTLMEESRNITISNNKRRGGEVSRLLLQTYNTRPNSKQSTNQFIIPSTTYYWTELILYKSQGRKIVKFQCL